MIRGELGGGGELTATEETQEVTVSLAAATGTSEDAATSLSTLLSSMSMQPFAMLYILE